MAIKIDINTASVQQLKKHLVDVNRELEKATDPKEFSRLNNELKQTEKAVNDINEAVNKVDLTAKFDDLYEGVQPLSGRLGELEDRMYELAFAGKQNTDEFRQLQEEAVTMRQTIIKVDESVDDLAGNRGLSTFGEQLGGIGESLLKLDFTRAERQAASLAKTAQSIDFKTAIGSVKSLGKTFLSLGKALLSNPIFLIVGAVVAIGVAIVTLLDKLGLLKVITTAIGDLFEWLGGILDALIQPLKDLTDWLGWTTNAAEEAAEKQVKAAEKKANATENATNKGIQAIQDEMRLLDSETELKISQAESEEEIAAIEEGALKIKAQLRLRELELIKLNEEAKLNELTSTISHAKIKGNLADKELADLEAKAELQQQIYDQAVKNIELEEEIIENSAKTRANNKEKDKEDNTQDDNKQKLADYKDYQNNRLKIKRQLEDIKTSSIEDSAKKELAINRLKYDRLIEDTLADVEILESEKDKLKAIFEVVRDQKEDEINQKYIDKKTATYQKGLEARFSLEDQQWNMLQKLQNTAEEQELLESAQKYDKMYEKALGNAELENAILEKQQEEASAIRENYRLQREENDKKALATKTKLEEEANQEILDKKKEHEEKVKQITQASLGVSLQGLSAIMSLNDAVFSHKSKNLEEGSEEEEKLAKRNFEINKKLQIAQALISGVQASINAYTSTLHVPIVGPVLAPIAAALSAVAVGAQVSKIKSMTFEGGGSNTPPPPASNISDSARSESLTPNVNLFGNGNNLNNGGNTTSADGTQQNQNQTINVNVGISEITETQNNITNYQESATL